MRDYTRARLTESAVVAIADKYGSRGTPYNSIRRRGTGRQELTIVAIVDDACKANLEVDRDLARQMARSIVLSVQPVQLPPTDDEVVIC